LRRTQSGIGLPRVRLGSDEIRLRLEIVLERPARRLVDRFLTREIGLGETQRAGGTRALRQGGLKSVPGIDEFR